MKIEPFFCVEKEGEAVWVVYHIDPKERVAAYTSKALAEACCYGCNHTWLVALRAFGQIAADVRQQVIREMLGDPNAQIYPNSRGN